MVGALRVVLTGDMHWGRLVTWQSIRSPLPGAKLVEFISSPIARIATRSILSSKFSVARKAEPVLPTAHLGGYLAEYERRSIFATNENNLGLLRLWQPAGGPLRASFALWNLDTFDLALNQWGAGPCWAELTL